MIMAAQASENLQNLKRKTLRYPLGGIRPLFSDILVADSSTANGKTKGAATGVSNGDIDHDDSEDEKDDEAGAGEAGAPGGAFPHNPDLALVFTKAL